MTTRFETPRGATAALLNSDALTSIWVVIGLAMGPAVALGLARFAYALLLPAMRAELGWSFADAGVMNTANALGYLAGALIAAPLGKRIGDKRGFAAGLLGTSLAIGATGLTANFTLLLVLRLLAGLSAAIAFVAGAGLTSVAAAGGAKSRAPTWLGIYFAGAGLGVIASAWGVQPLLGSIGWRGGWLLLGIIGLIASALGCMALRHCPQPSTSATGMQGGGWSPSFMARELIAYGLYGAGYIAYATFIVAFLRDEQGFNPQQVAVFWSVVGLAAVVAAFVWGPILARLGGGWGTAVTVAVVAVGAAVPLCCDGAIAAYVSAVLFGGSFLAVIAAVTPFARRAAQPHALTSVIGALTIAFGLGQCIGPVLSGALADGANGIRNGLWLSVGVLIVASVVAAFQPEPSER